VLDANRFLDWLCDLGTRQPGIVIYPTSDDAAFLYASRARDLSRNFRMYQPGVDAIERVLDKKKLYGAARAIGLDTPDTWFPETDEDVARVAREARFPVLVKSRTQVLSRTHTKGIIVTDRSRLVSKYRKFVDRSRYGRLLLDRIPDAHQAMIQQYIPGAAQHIYMLSAFLDRPGALFAARASAKVLQRPRSLGVGLCFETTPLLPALADGARRLARDAGYFGLFSAEFIEHEGRHLLIDFNPRFYNQLAFDVVRGMSTPEMVYAAATGDGGQLADLVRSAARAEREAGVFCNRFGMDFMLFAQRASGALSVADWRRWQAWREQRRAFVVDPTTSADDPLPGWVDATTQIYGCFRHPRSFVRGMLLDRATF
jgi:predicted ATP-grasp superfamily ATP-dependent carboligase